MLTPHPPEVLVQQVPGFQLEAAFLTFRMSCPLHPRAVCLLGHEGCELHAEFNFIKCVEYFFNEASGRLLRVMN